MVTMVETPDILLVEDDPEYVEAALKAMAHEKVSQRVFVVRDGQEALDYVFCRGKYSAREPECGHPKVILLDLNLPVVDGHEVLRQLKSNERTRTIPVVMLTSSEDRHDILASHEFGADIYFVKPAHASEFARLSRMLAQYGVLGPDDGRK
jgi:two-component system, response regulator